MDAGHAALPPAALQREQGGAGALEVGVVRLATRHLDGRAEGDGAHQRHGDELALRHDPVEVLDPDRDELEVRACPRELVKASLEGQQLGVGLVARALRKEDQRVAPVDRLLHHLQRIARPGLAVAVDQHGVEHVAADEAAQPRFHPVVGTSDRPRAAAQPRRQHRPDQQEVAVAGVVREIDPLRGRRLRTHPQAAHRRDEAGEQREDDRHGGRHRTTHQVGRCALSFRHDRPPPIGHGQSHIQPKRQHFGTPVQIVIGGSGRSEIPAGRSSTDRTARPRRRPARPEAPACAARPCRWAR